MQLSICTTLYRSRLYVKEFYDTCLLALSDAGFTEYEFIFVDDGSPDDSLDIIKLLRCQNPNIKYIQFSRNFGHHKALMTALEHSCGDIVFLLDSDLEENPNELKNLVEKMREDDVDLVLARQKKRKGNIFEKLSGYVYYTIINFLTDIKIPRNFCTMALFKKNVVKEISKYKESDLNYSTILSLVGFKRAFLLIDKIDKGESSYDLIKKINIMVNTITSSSGKPLRVIFYFGMTTLILSFLVILRIFYLNFLGIETLDGWSSIIASIWFIGGCLMTSVGVIGIYLSKVLIEVKRRPYVHIKDKATDR